MTWTVSATTGSPGATRQLAARLASVARSGDVVLLAGGLGAGKTTFAQGFAAGLGVEGPVTSPTFTLVRQYRCPLGQLLHADVYRLDHLVEVEDLGLPELLEEGGVALVEWGDVAAPALGPVAMTVTLEPVGDDVRRVRVTGEPEDRRREVADAIRRATDRTAGDGPGPGPRGPDRPTGEPAGPEGRPG